MRKGEKKQISEGRREGKEEEDRITLRSGKVVKKREKGHTGWGLGVLERKKLGHGSTGGKSGAMEYRLEKVGGGLKKIRRLQERIFTSRKEDRANGGKGGRSSREEGWSLSRLKSNTKWDKMRKAQRKENSSEMDARPGDDG